MIKTLELIDFIDQNSNLTKDVDLFDLDIPLNTSGIWIQDDVRPARKNSPDITGYQVYYRTKDKSLAQSNMNYFTGWVDSQPLCHLPDGTAFRLTIDQTWDFVGKDSEGYYIWNTIMTLVL